MTQENTIYGTLKNAGGTDAVAISAPDRPDLSHAGLHAQVERTVKTLNGLGIGRADRLAIVLPNGPEMASSFISIAAGASTAPLNPAYRQEEYEFYLSDLKAKALVVEEGSESPALAAAGKAGIPIIRLKVADGMAAGEFTLEAGNGISEGAAKQGGFAEATDEGLVLHTSGTTSRPKIVPLSQSNLAASARNIRKSLELTPNDRCMNIMPLFHIHGLIAAVLSSLSAGAGVYCTPGFNALKIYGWLKKYKPTWYTAVPTMHQAIMARAKRNQDIIEDTHLRFVRSSSSSLPPQVMAELETLFGCPVVEAYGMTEATHQMACNPIQPGKQKPGTVGIAAGPEVAIMSKDGKILSQGDTGEIVIRGDNVTQGYENNPKANAENFTNGWFRTGDQGVIDEDGYISITGRLKEIINRGGEKISPREIDEVLMDHPAVGQVVTFAVPHDKLGEEVAAAVVLREGASVDEVGLRNFAKEHLADFKVPRKIIFLEEIPKGATGKLQRIGMAEKLGLA